MSKVAEKPEVNSKYPAFRFRKALDTEKPDGINKSKDGYVMKLFNTAEDEAEAEAQEPGVHNWFNNPDLKVEKPNATAADLQAEAEAEIAGLRSDLESAKITVELKDKEIAALRQQVTDTNQEASRIIGDLRKRADEDAGKLADANKQVAKLTKDLEKTNKELEKATKDLEKATKNQ